MNVCNFRIEYSQLRHKVNSMTESTYMYMTFLHVMTLIPKCQGQHDSIYVIGV